MSKGSRQRPLQVSNEEYANRWEAIFGNNKKDDDEIDNQPAEEQDDDNSRTVSGDSRGD